MNIAVANCSAYGMAFLGRKFEVFSNIKLNNCLGLVFAVAFLISSVSSIKFDDDHELADDVERPETFVIFEIC